MQLHVCRSENSQNAYNWVVNFKASNPVVFN